MSKKDMNNVKLTVEFTEATTRANINSKENISILFGKIKKVITDLHSSAFTGNAAKVNGHTVQSDVPANAKFTDTTYDKATTTAPGLVPKLPTTTGTTKYLREDCTWSDIPSAKAITVTLTTAGWSSNSQTVTASGVTSSNNVIVTPAPDSQSAYISGGVVCNAQGTNTLTFKCTTTPTSALTVNVLIIPNS